jgi:hypothetical protein
VDFAIAVDRLRFFDEAAGLRAAPVRLVTTGG